MMFHLRTHIGLDSVLLKRLQPHVKLSGLPAFLADCLKNVVLLLLVASLLYCKGGHLRGSGVTH